MQTGEVMTGYATDGTRETLEAARAAVHRLERARYVAEDDEAWDPLTDSFASLQDDPEIGEVLQEALGHIAEGEPVVVGLLRDVVVPGLGRLPADIGVD